VKELWSRGKISLPQLAEAEPSNGKTSETAKSYLGISYPEPSNARVQMLAADAEAPRR